MSDPHSEDFNEREVGKRDVEPLGFVEWVLLGAASAAVILAVAALYLWVFA